MNPIETTVPESATMTTEEVVQWTKKLNYGTWRTRAPGTRCTSWTPRAATSPTANGKRYLDFSSQLMCSNLGHKNQAVIEAIAGAGRASCPTSCPATPLHRACRAQQPAPRSPPRRPQQILLHHLRHRGQRSRLQDRPHVHRQDQDHRPLPLLPRLDQRLDRRHRRPAPLAHRARRQRPRRRLRARGQLLQLPHQAHLSRLRHRLRRLPRAHDRQRERRRRRHRRARRRHQRRPRPAARVLPQAPRASATTTASCSSPTKS